MSGRLGVGVIGCGYWGPNLIRNFARYEGSEVVAVCDVLQERADKVAGWYNVPHVTTDPMALIRDPAVELVVVATPSGTHYPLAKAAIEAGKHALVMKPLTTSVADAEELMALAERQGVVLAVDHTFVYSGPVRRMREMVQNGDIGDVFYVDSVRINLGVFQSDINVIWDLGPHDVSIIDYILGGEMPTEVSAVAAAHAGGKRENIAYLTLRYGPQVLAHIHVNWLAPAKIRRTIVGGSKQMLVYDDMQPSEKLLVYDRGVTIAPWSDPERVYGELVSYRSGDVWAPRLDDREALAVEAEEVVKHIRTGSPLAGEAYSALRTVRILDAAARSARDSSQLVRVPDLAGTQLAPIPISVNGAHRNGNGRVTVGGNGVHAPEGAASGRDRSAAG